MGSAVDQANLTRELERYRDAGMGGVHIIPIYGAKGFESRFIEYLSPKWMEMLGFTVEKAREFGLGVDMTTGTGWCFGGPNVSDSQANAQVVAKEFPVGTGESLSERLDRESVQAVGAFGPQNQFVDLYSRVLADGAVDWKAREGSWRVFVVSQKPSGVRVKRAAPGGQGHMLNLIYPAGVTNYLRRFEEAFAAHKGGRPRAMYHDSYEYRSDWGPTLLAEFERRRGYRLETEFPSLFGNETTDRAARVKCDYRETVSDIMVEKSLPAWSGWARGHGFLTRNQAHGSPGNWLDLYAVADIPETEMFHNDRSRLISKFASSAAHVGGHSLVAAETGTWLKEHFTETLADMKYLQDDMFLSGVNHIVYHGTCYSPDDAPWPGWLFYASFEMNPRNSVWRDVGALNRYAARCQAMLQAGRPNNDILLYWPVHDVWHDATGMVRNMTVHSRDWFEKKPVGALADTLWKRGYAFDYISDRQLRHVQFRKEGVAVGEGLYRAIVVPATEHMPLETVSGLVTLARAGATVIFQDHLPADVPGWGNLQDRRRQLEKILEEARANAHQAGAVSLARLGKGTVRVGLVETALSAAGVRREEMFDISGLMCIRRVTSRGWIYFIANRSGERVPSTWLPLAHRAKSVVAMDPSSGATGLVQTRSGKSGGTEVLLELQPGQSMIFQCFADKRVTGQKWNYWRSAGSSQELSGSWDVRFIAGGPGLPPAFQTRRLISWTALGGPEAERFSGTARYSLAFDAPAGGAEHWLLDLGKVCQSAQVRLNGQDLGTVIAPPFSVAAGPLKSAGNLLEVEVTNVSANRIRDLDQRKVPWKNFYDINFVNLDYKPFDAANWPLADSGLLGPVTITPVGR